MAPRKFKYLVEYSRFEEDWRNTFFYTDKEEEKARYAFNELLNSVDVRYVKLYELKEIDSIER